MAQTDPPAKVASNDQLGRVETLAHRMAWRYKCSRDPNHSDTYTFNRATLLTFADALVAAERERCAAAVDHILREGGGTWGDWLRGSG